MSSRVDSFRSDNSYTLLIAKEAGNNAISCFIKDRITTWMLPLGEFKSLIGKVQKLLANPDESCDAEVWNDMCLTALLAAKTKTFRGAQSHQSAKAEADPFSPLQDLVTLFSRKDLTDADRTKLLLLFTDGFFSDEDLHILAQRKEIGNGRMKHLAHMKRAGLSTNEIFSLSFLPLLLKPESKKRVKGFIKCLNKGFPIEQLEKWHPESLILQFEHENPGEHSKRRRVE